MPNWNLFLRRIHLYLGMLLLPWMLMYAASTVVFNHRGLSSHGPGVDRQWQRLWEKEYRVEVPTAAEALRETARRVLADQGIKGAYFVQRQGQRLNINVPSFRQPLRLSYDLDAGRLRAEQRKNSWTEVLLRLHTRTGYGQPGLLNNVWALFVDLYCVTALVWIATGLYLWWKLPSTRGWGWLAIAGGLASIAILLGTL